MTRLTIPHSALARISVLFLIIVSCPLFGQPVQGVFKRLAEDAFGLGHAEVRDILQDREGFIWIATTKGLFRFDGHDLRVYRENPLDATSIGDNYITTLAEDKDGAIWIGTGNIGLVRYDRYREEFTNFPIQSKDTAIQWSSRVNDLLLDGQGRLWVATFDGLRLLDREAGQCVYYRYRGQEADQLAHRLIRCLAEDDEGRIWIGSSGAGLNRLDPATGAVKQFKAGEIHGQGAFRDNRIRSLSTDDRGQVWFSTFGDSRVYSIHTQTFELAIYDVFKSAKDDHRITGIWAGGGKGVWLATYFGLVYFDPGSGQYQMYQHDPQFPNSLPSNSIESLWLGRDEILWIGHLSGGVSQMTTKTDDFQILPVQFQASEASNLPNIKCLVEDGRGNLWVGTWKNGLYHYNVRSGKTTAFKKPDDGTSGLANDLVWDIMEDREGVMWFATHDGLQSFDPIRQTWKTYGEASGFKHRAIRCLWEDHTGRFWVGTFAGLHRFDPKTGAVEFVTAIAEKPSFIVHEIFEDSRQRLWVAAHGQGLFLWDRQRDQWYNFQKKRNDPKSLTSNIVRSIVEDDSGRIWLGTEGGGLNLIQSASLDPDSISFEHWRPYNSDFPDENVYGINIDEENRLWLNTDRGLYTFDPDDRQVKRYGLPGAPTGLEAETRPTLGDALYAGNDEYVYRFRPGMIREKSRLVKTYVSQLEIKGRPIAVAGTFGDSLPDVSPLNQSILYTSSIELNHRQNDLSFLLSGLHFQEPEKSRFRYRLEGYDEKWLETDALDRKVRYTNLPPGDYTFRVWAADREAVESDGGTAIAISIRPPWWQTRWAYGLYSLLGASILIGVRRYELIRHSIRAEARRLKELDAFKSEFYTNITHEFRTPLTIIMGIMDQLKNEVRPPLKDPLQMVHRNAVQLLNLVNQLLDLSKLEKDILPVKPVYGELISFIGYHLQSFESVAAAKNIRLHFLREAAELRLNFDPDHLTTVLQNLLSNALKYTPAGGDVYLMVRHLESHSVQMVVPAEVKIEIRDTGPGIPAEELNRIFDRYYRATDNRSTPTEGNGIGLSLVKELIRLMKGRIEVESKLGHGTTFTVYLPGSRRTASNGTTFPIEEASKPGSSGSESASAKATVLLIDDNEDVLLYLTSCLEMDYHVIYATNGQAGLEKALMEVPDLVVSDVMMPEKDGYQLVQELRNDDRTSHIPILLLTARVDMESRLRGLEYGADAYLVKPFESRELTIRLRKLLELRKQLQKRYRSLSSIEVAEDPVVQKQDDFMSLLRHLLEEHMGDENFGIEQICRLMNASRTQLHRKLKALTGQSASLVIRRIRLQKAKALLLETDWNVSEVGYSVGFKNPSYFSACFSEEFGMAPRELRTLHKNP